ncbi:MAG: hypothetical protein WHU95_07100 [candidate division WOR-3 bacterium]|jgi:uncharacterized protein YwgA|nr:hypothetical protein [candidate division WOR-3 bacterium]MDH7519441.1 hypothetical protein [bacterium]
MQDKQIQFLLNQLRQEIEHYLNGLDPSPLWQKLQTRLTEKDRRTYSRRIAQLKTRPASIRLTDRKDILLLLLYLRGISGKLCEPILGITRITKLLFIAFQELALDTVIKNPYRFVPYKLGPFSPELYTDLKTLTDLGIITAHPLDPEGVPIINLDRALATFLATLNSGITATERLDAVNLAFTLTPQGKQIARLLAQTASRQKKNLLPGLQIVKTNFASLPLTQLLRYVYTRYPEYTTASEIVAKVLGKPAPKLTD